MKYIRPTSRFASLTIALAFFLMAFNVSAADPDWLLPIKESYQRVEQHLQNVTVTVERSQKDDRPGEGFELRNYHRQYEYHKYQDSLLMVEQEDPKVPHKLYSAVNPSYFFMLNELNPGAHRTCQLMQLGERSEYTFVGGAGNKAVARIIDRAYVVNEHLFGLYESPYEVFRSNANHLKAEFTELEGKRVLLLKGDFVRIINTAGIKAPLKPPTYENSSIYLDPALDYRMVLWEVSGIYQGKEYTTSTSFEYNHQLNGYPMLSKVSCVPKIARDDAIEYQTVLSNWREGENSQEIFYLSHYGLKEPSFAKSWLSGWMKLLLAGAAICGIGVWLRRRSAAATSK